MTVTAPDQDTLQNNQLNIVTKIANITGLSISQISLMINSISSTVFEIDVTVSDGSSVSSAQGVTTLFTAPNVASQLSIPGVMNVTELNMVPLSNEQQAPYPLPSSTPPSGLSTGVIVAIVVVCCVVAAAVVIIIIVVVTHKKKKGKQPKPKKTQPVTTQPTPQPPANQQQKPREAESEKSSSGLSLFNHYTFNEFNYLFLL
jgi:hypothetical protein